jgi:hypothetical protein
MGEWFVPEGQHDRSQARSAWGVFFVPEGHAIVARRFIAGLAIHRICVPEGRLKLDLGCYQSDVPDRFEVKNSTHPRSEFRRPSGTQAMGSRTPAINTPDRTY